MTEKRFQFKGQQVNYYNKVKTNPNITFLVAGLDSNGYFVRYNKKVDK